MPRIAYEESRFRPDALRMVAQANDICTAYAAQGLDLTLRQLYYQFVARGLIPNKQSEYKRLGDIVNKARLAGLIDWDHLVDRTRNLRSLAHWNDPSSIIDAVASQYRTDRWASQPYRVEVWIEKDALVGVLDAVCPGEDVPYFSCRGYTSQSEVWGAAQRLGRWIEGGQSVLIIHLGDHDPSGIDMTRDITDRLRKFIIHDYVRHHDDRFPGDRFFFHDVEKVMSEEDLTGRPPLEVRRIALNMDQVEAYNPPPNPAKITDSRARGYMEVHGDESWELDALDPTTLIDLIRENIESVRDQDEWDVATDAMVAERRQLALVRDHWDSVVEGLERGEGS